MIVLNTDAVAVIIDIPESGVIDAPRSFSVAAKTGDGGIGERETPGGGGFGAFDFERRFWHFWKHSGRPIDLHIFAQD
jgi:hypothetical protein